MLKTVVNIRGRMTIRIMGFLLGVLLLDVLTASVAFGVERTRARPDSLAGRFLVASPHWQDPHFGKTIVFICRHDDKGAIGLIINRPSSVPVSRIFPDIPALRGTSQRLYVGGPVQTQGILMLVQAGRAPATMRMIVEGVYWGGDRDVVRQMMDGDVLNRLRVYAGHASWAPGQLARELSMGVWKQTGGDVASVFDPSPHMLWESWWRSLTAPQHTIGSR